MSDMRDNVYADLSGIPHRITEHGKTWVSDEWLAAMGWTKVADDYEAPVSDAEKKHIAKLALDAEYEPYYTNINKALAAASSLDNTAAITAIKSKKVSLLAAHKAAKEAIDNG